MNNLNAPIEYEYDFRPEAGQAVDILPGIKWLHLPLPFVLSHINTWLLEDEHGWAIVDTGFSTSATREAWEDVFTRYLDNASISRVLVTHLHPDHVGCAGWLCDRFDVDLYMTREEYLLCRILVADTGLPAPEEGQQFYREAGFSEEHMGRYMEMFGSFGRVVSQLPQSYRRLHEGRTVNIGSHQWQVLIGRGHSPEHACLFCPELNVLISGDHERIRRWRLKESIRRTLARRPDMIEEGCLEGERLELLEEIREEGDAGPDGPCDEV